MRKAGKSESGRSEYHQGLPWWWCSGGAPSRVFAGLSDRGQGVSKIDHTLIRTMF